MRTVFIAILTICYSSLLAQVNEPKPLPSNIEKDISSQGEAEDNQAVQFFKENYSKRVFKKYKGDIAVNGNSFKYADQTLVVSDASAELKAIFYKGLFYPSIIVQPNRSEPKSQDELVKLTAEQRAIYNLTRTDSLTIANLEEMPFLSKSPTKKRFRFWLYRKGLHNPQVCFFELTNGTATNKTTIEAFIEGAILTFYKGGWIII